MSCSHEIYIHVPYCISKCNYCAFWSMPCANPDWDAWSDGIIGEIERWANKLNHPNCPTIFFGGGTPSLMPTKTFGRIIDAIAKNFHITDDAEITIESNPGTIDTHRVRELINIAMNRISVGVQSLDDKRLQFLGRRHDADTARRFICDAMDMGIRTSADFIYGLPGDTPEYVTQMCNEINALGLQHCSMYELTIEENTPFGRMNLSMPSDADMAKMYQNIAATLSIPRYEVSNYAHPGNECRHNANIWDGAAYIGIGRGAAGRPFFDNKWHDQTGGPNGQCNELSDTDRAIEMVITGMRTMRGIYVSDMVSRVLNHDFINAHPELVTRDGNRIRATNNGILILDNLLIDLTE